MNPPARDPLSTRYSLLSRLQDWGDQESWKDFFDTYWRLIHSIAKRANLSEDEAQEVVQETVISVAKSIHKFQRDHSLGSFKSWLRNIIRWRIIDQLKKRRPARVGNEEIDLRQVPAEITVCPDTVWDEEWAANLLETAMERIKGRVKAEQYQMFYLYAVKNLPVSEVAEMLRVSIGQVYVNKHRIAAMLKKEIKRMDQEPAA